MSDFSDAVKKAEIKSGFNDRVQAERNSGGLLDKPNILKFPTAKLSVEYKLDDGDYFQEVWPTTFKGTPRIGDMIESQSGRTLKIKGITYKVGGIVLITLGREMGGSTGIEGAGTNTDDLVTW